MMASSSAVTHSSAQEQPVEGEGSGSALFGRRSGDQVETRMPLVAMKEEQEECTLGHSEGGERGRGRREEQTDSDLIFGGPRPAQGEETKVEGSPLADRAAESNRSLLQAAFQPDPAQTIKRPTWLANAVLRLQAQQASAAGNGTGESNMGSNGSQENGSYGGHWLSMPVAHYENGSNGSASPPQGGDLVQQGFKNNSMYNGSSLRTQYDSAENGYRQGHGGDDNGDGDNSSEPNHDTEDQENWVLAKRKADIVAHPLFPELLSAHVACLRIATPVDQLGTIDAQLSQSHLVISKYQALSLESRPEDNPDKEELEQYMADNVMLLRSFKDQLQQHVRVHAMEAVMSCYDLEKQLEELTGVRAGESGQTSGYLMSDDEDDAHGDSDLSAYDPSLDGAENGGFGPLIPTETERTLMERVRQELKAELKQGYKAKIIDVREEILRKRRAGKLPGDTTTVLKTWWHAHAKWPYPTEDEKARLVQETGLELKQINNWFINQRKRNWHANPSAAAAAKTKRKS